MIISPILKREAMVSQRSIKLSVFVMIFNSILALATLIFINRIIYTAKTEALINHAEFLDIFGIAAYIELVMLLLIVPFLTAGSISGEREKKTLDLMLTTMMTPADIVISKALSAFFTAFLLVCSSAPILSLAFLYGGITFSDMFMLILSFFISIFFVGCIGILFSSICKTNTISMAFTYVIAILGIFGTFLAKLYLSRLLRLESYTADVINAQVLIGTEKNLSVSGMNYILLFNPIVTFFIIVNTITGKAILVDYMFSNLSNYKYNIVDNKCVFIGFFIQILLGSIFLALSVFCISPRKNKFLS